MAITFHTFYFLIFTFEFLFTTENTEKHRKIISRKDRNGRNVSLFIFLADVAGMARKIISRKERYERYEKVKPKNFFCFFFTLANVAGVARKIISRKDR